MIRLFIHCCLLALVCAACSDTTSKDRKTETLEIFSTTGTKNDKRVDSLRYFESTEYLDGRKMTTSYFNSKGVLTGKEKRSYDDDGKLVGGGYYSKGGDLLSYYDFITNANGDVIAEYGFDASNDQLLSIKNFEYDMDGNVKIRRVFESDYTLYRRYDFAFDSKGNERSMQVSDTAGEPVLNEEFTIVQTDSLGNWTEKWGFVNDAPVTFYKKSW